MKKLLLLVFALGLISTSANATTMIKYNNAGAAINVPNNFGSNAIFTPRNQAIQAERARRIKYMDQYYSGLEKGNTINVNINSSDPKRTYAKPKKRTYLKDRLKNKTEEEK